jgi:hypothetical protein
MGKFIGLLLSLVCIWVALEVYNEGLDNAFGGALAQLEDGEGAGAASDGRSIPQRAGDAVERAHAVADARRNKLLGE